MKKKIVFGIALLIVLTASLSAQAAYVHTFLYTRNGNEREFTQDWLRISNGAGVFETTKLPNPVIQAINNNLRNFTLNIGDIFICALIYNQTWYVVTLRITDARNSRWQFYAAWTID